MKLIKQAWATKSDIESIPFQSIIERYNITNWSRVWEYPFVILNSDIKESLKILDIGCRSSHHLLYLGEKHCIRYGIDIEEAELDYVDHFQKGNVLDIPFEDNTFDRIYCVSVLEHIEDIPPIEVIKRSLKEMERVARPGALIVVTVDISSGNYKFKPQDFKQGYPFEVLPEPSDILLSDDSPEGRKLAGLGAKVFGFVLENEFTY